MIEGRSVTVITVVIKRRPEMIMRVTVVMTVVTKMVAVVMLGR